MRSTGEVMAFALDFPSAFARAERAAGRPLPAEGTAFLSVRDADKQALVPVAETLAGLGFRLVATERHSRSARRRRASRSSTSPRSRRRTARDRRRPHPPPPVRPRREHAAGLRGAERRLPDPRGRARGARALHHDPCRRGRGRRGHRPRPRRGGPVSYRNGMRQRQRLSVIGVERGRALHAAAGRAGRARPGHPGAVLHALAAGSSAAATDEPLPRPARRAGVPGGSRRARARARSARSSRATSSPSSARSATASISASSGRCSSAAASASRRCPTSRRCSERPPAVLGFRSDAHAEAARLLPQAEVVVDPVLVTVATLPGTTCSRAGPSRCCTPSASSCRTRNSPGRRRWPAATAPATAARSRSTASGSGSAWKDRYLAA